MAVTPIARRRTRMAYGTACAIAVIVLLPAPAIAAPSSPAQWCVVGNQYLKARLLDRAATAYAKAKGDACASQGLHTYEIAKGQALRALAEAKAAASSDADRARALLLQALAIDAGLDEATKLLDKLDLPNKDPFAAARALKSAGYRDQAKTEAVKQVTDNGAPTIPHDLLNSELKSGHPLLTDVKDEATIALEVLVGVIVAALVVNFLMVMGFGPVTMNRLGVGFAGSESRLKLWLGALW